jgi:hypothetical protein
MSAIETIYPDWARKRGQNGIWRLDILGFTPEIDDPCPAFFL